jgi:CRP-like cAMP-binding protein
MRPTSFRPTAALQATTIIEESGSLYDEPEPQSEDELQPVMSFRNAKYESKDMLRLLSLHDPPDTMPPGLDNVSYQSSDVLPEWILSDPAWKNAPKQIDNQNEISEILKLAASKRSQEQVETLIHWLMSVWGIANTMGFKRCDAMIKEFKYQEFEEGDNVITEGERGLTFYIIISGNTTVYKEGIGVVGQLGKGKSFGEIALTQGKDLRTATVKASTKLEVLSLHKNDYDYFVRDFQETERRENFQILSNCNLFKTWPKGKIDKICNTCARKTFEPGSYIFKQGDSPEDLCVIVEGTVSIIKELVIVCKNRWPTGTNQWQERVKKVTKPIMLKTLQR